jgi:hypothetical protein
MSSTPHSEEGLVKIPLEVLKDLISVTRSVNRGQQHEVRLRGEDEPCYWQRKEWVDWAVEAGELAAAELERVNQPPKVSAPESDQEDVTDVWTEFSYRGHRLSFNDTQLALYGHYHSFHGLTDPTVASVIAYIDQLPPKIQIL